MAIVVNYNVRLGICRNQYLSGKVLEKSEKTHNFQVAMYYSQRMEIAKTVGHIPQLRYSSFKRIGGWRSKSTHKGSAIHLRVFCHVRSDLGTFRTIIHNLEL